MTQKEFEEKMKELKDKYGIPDELCFKMDANFTIDEDVKNASAKRVSMMKTAAAADFFTHMIKTNIEQDMQILEAGILDKGDYMYIATKLKGVPSVQMIRPIFKDKDGGEIPDSDTDAEDFVIGKLMNAFARAADSMKNEGGAPNVLVRDADSGAPYENINGSGEGRDGKDIFIDFAVNKLDEMSEKERYMAMHINRLFAEDENVPPERCFAVEVSDKEEAEAKLDEYMKEAGKEYISCTFDRRNRVSGKNDFVYGSDGKNCLTNFVLGPEKRINFEPYENLDDALMQIVKSID